MSWGHKIRWATPRELECPWEPSRHWHCTASKCREPAAFHTRYYYVTGQAGRTSCADRLLCQEHGERFAKKYKLELPTKMVLT